MHFKTTITLESPVVSSAAVAGRATKRQQPQPEPQPQPQHERESEPEPDPEQGLSVGRLPRNTGSDVVPLQGGARDCQRDVSAGRRPLRHAASAELPRRTGATPRSAAASAPSERG